VRSLLEVDSKSFLSSITSIVENKKRILEDISEKLSAEEYKAFQNKLDAAQKAFLVTDTYSDKFLM
jgi:hypothetical protein